MLTGYPLIGFIPVRDAERARHFYEETLGLAFLADDGAALVFMTEPASSDMPGNMIRIVRTGEFTPAPYTILGWEVTDLPRLARTLASRGVAPKRYSFLHQEENGLWTAPNGSRILWFGDPDGNTLSLSEHAAT